MEYNPTVRIVLALLLLFIFSCQETPTPDDDDDQSYLPGLFTDHAITVDGATRYCDYYIPQDAGASLSPLLFLLHGGGSSKEDLTGASGHKAPYRIWMDIADTEKVIIVYPQGTMNSMEALGWNDCRSDATTNPTRNDVAFIDALIDHFSSSFAIDPNRVYATGTSNGGHLSLRLALELSDRIAAVAPVAAAMPERSGCRSPHNPVSVLFMNGTEDPLLPYGGGEVAPEIGGRGTVLSTQASVEFWTDVNRTDATAAVVDFPDINVLDGTTVKRITYANGIGGAQVILYEVSGGGHMEPSIREQYSAVAELYLGRQNHDIEMAREIWNFFKDKTL
jgi:polyhydroxybutyrate depolymerase